MQSIDVVIIVAYVAGCLALGARLGAKVQGLSGYLLGGRNVPAWAVMISIVATETSTATFLSVPGVSFRPGGNLTYLQLALGYVLGRVVVTCLLLPGYFRGEIYTAYEVLNRRFGGATRTTASVLFLVTRTLGDGLRLFLAALVLGELTGWNIAASIAVMGLATVVYTYLGGIRAVIWTDVIQFFIYMAGAVVALALMMGMIPGGWNGLMVVGSAAGKFQVFDFALDVTKPQTFWAGLIGGMFLNTATHGADQLMVQRYLTARSQRQAAAALITSGLIVLAQFALFLFIGAGLYALYRGTPAESLRADRAFAYFIVRSLPVGVVGLVVAAIFSAAMSTLSSSLSASASTSVNDLIKPCWRTASESTLLRVSKGMTLVWGMAQMGIALGASRLQSLTVVDAALEIASFTTGIVLGLFVLGLFTNVRERSALVGLVTGLAVVSYLKFGAHLPDSLYPWGGTIAWPWFALIGCTTVLVSGWLAEELGLGGPRTKQSQSSEVLT